MSLAPWWDFSLLALVSAQSRCWRTRYPVKNNKVRYWECTRGGWRGAQSHLKFYKFWRQSGIPSSERAERKFAVTNAHFRPNLCSQDSNYASPPYQNSIHHSKLCRNAASALNWISPTPHKYLVLITGNLRQLAAARCYLTHTNVKVGDYINKIEMNKRWFGLPLDCKDIKIEAIQMFEVIPQNIINIILRRCNAVWILTLRMFDTTFFFPNWYR